MKKITLITSSILLFMSVNLHSQQTAVDALENAKSAAELIRLSAKNAKTTLRTLAIDYFVNNNPNPDVNGFYSSISDKMEIVEENSDEVNYFISVAENANPNIDGSEINDWANEIEGLEDAVLNKSNMIRTQILNGNRSQARQLNQQIRADLNTIISLAKLIKAEVEQLKTTPQNFNIRIELVDSQSGLPVNANVLPGYAATNLDTGVIYYAGSQQGQEIDEFLDLPDGNYRFDAYSGYFDGASSAIATLSSLVIGNDGFAVVTLSYWSE